MARALYWFTCDLRLQDNLALTHTLAKADEIAFVYVINPANFSPNNYQHRQIGLAQWQFICESLLDLNDQLSVFGHKLDVLVGNPVKEIVQFALEHKIDIVGTHAPVGYYEQRQLSQLETLLNPIHWITSDSNGVFEGNDTPLPSDKLTSFSKFRKWVESPKQRTHFTPREVSSVWLDNLPQPLASLPQAPVRLYHLLTQHPQYGQMGCLKPNFIGGERLAKQHVYQYFAGQAPASYKATRNALDGRTNSTKFSPYLAVGNLSARQIWHRVIQYEQDVLSNDSTYWIKFELLWREYFHFVARAQGKHMYRFGGINRKSPLTSYFPERFRKWCAGSTPYPLVNALMHELNETGYMSNRGRQIAASCLVNELGLDWRYGAAYFQQQLIDHDVAANWGNWQYIAGVGCDPRGGRHFDIAKQTRLYDPDQAFINKWQGKAVPALDSIDAADWPVVIAGGA